MNNLGIALGAYTQETNRQREQQRADAADQRQQQQFDLQMQEAERVKGIRSQRESEVQRLKQIRGALANPNDPTNWTVLQQAAKDYGVGNIERMGNSVGVFAGGEQGVPQFKPLDLGAYSNAVMERLAFADAEQALPYLHGQATAAKEDARWNAAHGLKTRELDGTMDYRNRQLSLQERELAANTAYRNAALALRGQGGGRGGAGAGGLSPVESDALLKLQEAYVATNDPAERARIAQQYSLMQNRIQLARGKVPNLPSAMVQNPRPGAMGYEALGSTGLIQDKATGTLYRQDEEGNLVPAQAGSSFDTLLENFGSALRPQDGRPSIKPAEGFEPRGGFYVTRPSAQVEYVRNPVTGQLITRDEYNRLTGEGGSRWGNLFGGR